MKIMVGLRRGSFFIKLPVTIIAILSVLSAVTGKAQSTNGPRMLDPRLAVRAAATNLNQPVGVAFLGANDMLVLEKASGLVKRFVNGTLMSTALDLNVNFNSERGLLSIALHPDFPANPGVYLYWTESLTNEDSGDAAMTPLLGNRVDRFHWDGTSLTLEQNLIRLHAFQADANQPLRGNHNGGVIRFGPDGKLYIIIGDNGRRGWLQDLQCGPTATCPPVVQDDQFGGPEPDAAHLTGVVLRLNDDGSTPEDNPFFDYGATLASNIGTNIQKIFYYGIRNSFGLAFDPKSGELWEQENGDDSFDEMNHIERGGNGGWIQFMGPMSRIAEFKAIETSSNFFGLQQVRWPPTLIADTPEEAFSRLVLFPGAHYHDPEFSWRYAVAPAGIGFLNSKALGAEFDGDLFVGASRTFLANGYLFRFRLTGNGKRIVPLDPRLEDGVADNNDKFTLTESESLLVGTDFGIGTDIETGANGNLFVVSLSNGAVYEIYRPAK